MMSRICKASLPKGRSLRLKLSSEVKVLEIEGEYTSGVEGRLCSGVVGRLTSESPRVYHLIWATGLPVRLLPLSCFLHPSRGFVGEPEN